MSSDAKPQHLFAAMLASVQAATTAVLGSGTDVSRIVVEPPRDPTHGDMATNAAMVLAKDAGKKPRDATFRAALDDELQRMTQFLAGR